MSTQIDFIQQREIHSGGKVTLPSKVADRLIIEEDEYGLQAHWNINIEHNDVVLSTVELKENYTTSRDHTSLNKESNVVWVPDKIMDLLNINIGDDVYFIGMFDDEYRIPAVLFWTFERMTKIMLEGNKQTSYDYLRVPEFV